MQDKRTYAPSDGVVDATPCVRLRYRGYAIRYGLGCGATSAAGAAAAAAAASHSGRPLLATSAFLRASPTTAVATRV